MQIKRSPISPVPVQPLKSANLAQPLINISKASTPVRTRLVATSSQPNSTPININKIVSNITKSPNNKQNYTNNYYKTQVNHKMFSQVPDTENRINLSPILALNRKINEGHQNYSKKSLTPQGHKVNQDYNGFTNFGFQQLERNYSSTYMNDSKGKNFMSNTTNLRGSNCFKALIDNRNRSPNKLQGSNSKQLNKKDAMGLLKQSSSSNNMFRNFGRESKSKLMESRSFDNLKTFGMSRMESSQIKCMNNDGKKAKYRVKNSQEESSVDQTQLYYCSKCTIPLVQQGFIVQQIGKENNRNDYQPQGRRYNDYYQKIQKKKRQVQNILTQISNQQQSEIARLDQYYMKIFEYLQAQRNTDRKIIQNYYQEQKQRPIAFLQKIDSYFEEFDQITNSTRRSAKLQQLEQLLQTQQAQLVSNNQFLFQSNISQLVDRFTKNYQQNLKLTWFNSNPIQQNQASSHPKIADQISSRNHAMRFSFEKLIQDMNNKKVSKQQVSPLNEVDEDQQNDGVEPQKQQHTAFRDLFPQEEVLQIQAPVYSPTFKNF